MFNGVGWGEVVVLLLIGLFVFGPDRLPRAARDAGRMLRQFRQMANGMRNDLRSELADLDLRDLHPKTFVRKHLFEGDDDDSLFPAYPGKRTSFESLLGEDEPPVTPALTKAHLPTGAESGPAARAGGAKPVNRPSLTKPSPTGGTAVAASPPTPAPAPVRVERAEPKSTPPPFDPDTT
ncbi:Sec-independent protein translocase protein TatB [Parafrankia discariae]|uniref:Sec-independent protein translocase protein TatB n=1 Tax=Parafrankia discariae TaxID=365528 RepID=UPI00037E71DA